MSDEIDATNERVEKESALIVGDICRRAQEIPKGQPGECFQCGEYFARVVFIESHNALFCARCRDKRGLK